MFGVTEFRSGGENMSKIWEGCKDCGQSELLKGRGDRPILSSYVINILQKDLSLQYPPKPNCHPEDGGSTLLQNT
jgi:hypothetical protein